MKKTCFALLAMCAFAGAASAQSATIYGRVDLGVTKQNNGTTGLMNGGAADAWEVRQGSGSRLGFRGREELGGGLVASFGLEHRFSPDTGAADAPFWAHSWVGLKSDAIGEVRLGRDYSPAWYVATAGDAFGTETVGSVGTQALFAGYDSSAGAGRIDNAVIYKSPMFGNVSASVAIGAGEGSSNGRVASMNVEYKVGPLYAGFAREQRKSVLDNDVTIFAGAYDLGVVRLVGSYAKASVDGQDNRVLSLGATKAYGAGVAKVGYTQLTEKRPGKDADGNKLAIGYEHNLSKRTALYTDLASAKFDGETRTTAYDIGVRHSF